MKITAIKTLRLEEFANLLWVFIETVEGLVGLGETFFGPQAVEAWIHETGAPLLIGQDPLRLTYLHRKMQGYCGVRAFYNGGWFNEVTTDNGKRLCAATRWVRTWYGIASGY